MRAILLAFLLTLTAVSQQSNSAQTTPPKTALHGTFTADAGRSAAFRGRWTGETNRNSGSGSCVLLSDSNKIVAEGTWSAQKSAAGWRGTSTARADRGRQYSGSLQADLEGFSGRTFEDMLNQTLQKQVSGSWRSRKLAGNWWLQGTKW